MDKKPVVIEQICINTKGTMIKTKITDYKSEVEKNDELQLQNVSLDNKMNMLKTLIESFDVDECQRIAILTETDDEARVIEFPYLKLTDKQNFIKVTALHDCLPSDHQNLLFKSFLFGRINMIALSFNLMEYLIKKHKKIVVNKVIAYNLPQHFQQYCLLNSSSGLIVKEYMGMLCDLESENDRKKLKFVVSFLKKDGKVIPDCLLNLNSERQS